MLYHFADMEMKVTSEKIENAQIKLNIEVGNSELDIYMNKAYHELVSKVSVPGFRKGRTPRMVLEKHIGRERLLKEALEYLIPEAYKKAVEEEKIEPVLNPDIELVQAEPVIFNAIVPLKPDINLGKYEDIRLEYKVPEIGDELINETLKKIQYQNSTLMPVDRPAEFGDQVIIDFTGEENGNQLPERKDLVYELIKDLAIPIPGFVDQLIGCKVDEDKSFSLNYPDDYEQAELAGKEYRIKVKIKEIKKRILPDINDDLAKSIDVENLDVLREQIKKDLITKAEIQYNQQYEQELVDKLIEISKVEFSPIFVDIEIDSIINDECKNFRDGMDGLVMYLSKLNKTIQDHKKELYPIAEKRILRSLVLSEITEKEKIEAFENEIDSEIDNFAKQNNQEYDDVKDLFSSQEARGSIRQFLTRKKTVDYLKKIAMSQS